MEKRREVLDYGLRIATSTWRTKECAVDIWTEMKKGVYVGFRGSVMIFGKIRPSGGPSEGDKDGVWVSIKASLLGALFRVW